MESLFRFALIRPPVSTDADAPGIQLAYNTPFQQQLAQAQQTSSSREAVKTIVRAFVASPAFKKNRMPCCPVRRSTGSPVNWRFWSVRRTSVTRLSCPP